MLVELIQLRREGVKLSRAELKAERPRLVELTMQRMGGEVRATYDCPWAATGHGYFPPYLEPAQVVVMRGAAFVIVGLETIGPWGAQRKVPQAWWCRIPAGGEAARPAPERTGSGAAVAQC